MNSENKRYTKRALLICIPVLLLFVFLVIMADMWTPYGDTDWDRFTETTEAIVVSVETRQKSNGDDWYTAYTPTYEYSIAGKTYSGTPVTTSRDEYNIGDMINVFYDPDKPYESVMDIPEGAGSIAHGFFVVGGLMLLASPVLICCGLMAWGARIIEKKGESKSLEMSQDSYYQSKDKIEF